MRDNLVAIQAGLTAFSDLLVLIDLSSRLAGAPANDARAMSELTLVPALIWAVVWAVVALALIGAALWRAWLAPRPSVYSEMQKA